MTRHNRHTINTQKLNFTDRYTPYCFSSMLVYIVDLYRLRGSSRSSAATFDLFLLDFLGLLLLLLLGCVVNSDAVRRFRREIMTNVEELLDKLESCVISCNNIVTYKWISQEWGVHVNTAKQLLYAFTNNGKSRDSINLEVIYFISGILNDGEGSNTYQVSLVRQKDLEKTKSKYKTILSEHVYSVQSSSLKDLHDLYIVDKVIGENVIQGKCGKSAIKCTAAVPRSTEAFEQLRVITTSAKSEPPVNSAQSGSVSNGTSSKEESTKSKEVKEEPAVNGKIKTDGKKGIAGLFAAQSVKTAAKKSDTDSPDANKDSPKNIVQKLNNQKNGIANMFAKQAKKPPAKKPKKEEPKKKVEPPKTTVIEKEEEEDPFASEDEADIKREIIIEDERSKSPVKVVEKVKAYKNVKENKKRKKRVNGIAGEEESPLPSKKRRRIKMMDSSEESSDEEMEVGESESPIPKKTAAISDDDEDDIIPATPTESQESGEKKRRKKRILQDKTFFDDSGYIVTKKEYVFVSCSEESNENAEDAKSNEMNSKTDSGTPSSNEIVKKKNEVPVSTNEEDTSPKEKEAGKKRKKGKEDDKSKKGGKKFSPQNVKQGVLTSFFKRTS